MGEPKWPRCARTKDGRIKAIADWPSNAELIADVAELHLDRSMHAVDLTYGLGVWWKRWRPDRLVCHDLDREKGDGVDFRALPEADCTYDLVAWDAPYVSPGGRETSTLDEDSDLWDRFGMSMTPENPGELRPFLEAGLSEAARVVKPLRRSRGRPVQGLVLAKVQDFNWGGTYHPVTRWIGEHAGRCGLVEWDRFDIITSGSRQPGGRTQRKAVRNGSTLLVYARRLALPAAPTLGI